MEQQHHHQHQQKKAKKKRRKPGRREYDIIYTGSHPLSPTAWEDFSAQVLKRINAASKTASNNNDDDDDDENDVTLLEAAKRLLDLTLDIPGPPSPLPPTSFSVNTLAPADAVAQTQAYIASLQYNHTGMQFFQVKKYLPISRLIELGKRMVKLSLPIKCLEAIIIALYLLQGQPTVYKFPISFKSKYNGAVFKHIVLGVVVDGNKYGAIGLSRRATLMNKPCEYTSLGSLLQDFVQSYAAVGHTVVRIRLGEPIGCDRHSTKMIEWRQLIIMLSKADWSVVEKACDTYCRNMRKGLVTDPVVVRYLRQPQQSTTTTPRGSSSSGSTSKHGTDSCLDGLSSGATTKARVQRIGKGSARTAGPPATVAITVPRHRADREAQGGKRGGLASTAAILTDSGTSSNSSDGDDDDDDDDDVFSSSSSPAQPRSIGDGSDNESDGSVEEEAVLLDARV